MVPGDMNHTSYWISAWKIMMDSDRIDTELSRMRTLGKFLP